MSDFITTARESIGLAIGFIVFVLFLSMMGGDKMVEAFLWLVLLGTLVFNAGILGDWLKQNF